VVLYALLLIVIVSALPQGVYGAALERVRRWRS
jgi:hypothetical protein